MCSILPVSSDISAEVTSVVPPQSANRSLTCTFELPQQPPNDRVRSGDPTLQDGPGSARRTYRSLVNFTEFVVAWYAIATGLIVAGAYIVPRYGIRFVRRTAVRHALAYEVLVVGAGALVALIGVLAVLTVMAAPF